METLKFKTNFKCSGCIATATPFLDAVAGKEQWKVNEEGANKILVVNTDQPISGQAVINAVEKAGYKAEQL